MTSSTTTSPTEKTSSLLPVANNMLRRVSFGATPTPERIPDSRTPSKKSSRASLKTSELCRMLLRHAAVDSMTESKVDKTKSISALDKQVEAKMAKLYKEKSKKGVAGVMDWL